MGVAAARRDFGNAFWFERPRGSLRLGFTERLSRMAIRLRTMRRNMANRPWYLPGAWHRPNTAISRWSKPALARCRRKPNGRSSGRGRSAKTQEPRIRLELRAVAHPQRPPVSMAPSDRIRATISPRLKPNSWTRMVDADSSRRWRLGVSGRPPRTGTTGAAARRRPVAVITTTWQRRACATMFLARIPWNGSRSIVGVGRGIHGPVERKTSPLRFDWQASVINGPLLSPTRGLGSPSWPD